VTQRPVSLRDRLFSHAVAIVFCVGFPAFVTWIAPVTWTTFTRHDGKVEMKAKVCMFFVLPFRRHELAEVTSIGQQTIAGTTSKFNGGTTEDQRRDVTSESEGFLLVQGHDQQVRIAISLSDLDDVRRKVRDFLDNPTAPNLKLFTVANWKVSVIAGGVTSLFTVLYLVSLLSWLFPSARQKSSLLPREFVTRK
jgi:hypothetical protein